MNPITLAADRVISTATRAQRAVDPPDPASNSPVWSKSPRIGEKHSFHGLTCSACATYGKGLRHIFRINNSMKGLSTNWHVVCDTAGGSLRRKLKMKTTTSDISRRKER